MKYRYFVENDRELEALRKEMDTLFEQAKAKRSAVCGAYTPWGYGAGNFSGIIVPKGEPIPDGWAFYKTKGQMLNGGRCCVPHNGKKGDANRQAVKEATFDGLTFIAERTEMKATVWADRIYTEKVGVLNNRIVGKIPMGDGEEAYEPPAGMREVKKSKWIAILEEGAEFGDMPEEPVVH